jgi:deazaflavin-dependent oxidoreductase (nitroreductase family)
VILRTFNRLFMRYLRTGLPAGPNVLLTVRGRSTGRLYSNPVALFRSNGRRFVQASFGNVNWVRNLRAAGTATLTMGRRSELVQVTELPAEAAGDVMWTALASHRQLRFLKRLLGPVTRPPAGVLNYFGLRIDDGRAAYVTEASRHPLFELHRSVPTSRTAGKEQVTRRR